MNALMIFSVVDGARLANIKFDDKINLVRVDYKTKKIMVSTKEGISIIHNHKIIE